MSEFNAELYKLTHEHDPGMNGIEKIVTGALIGFGLACLMFFVTIVVLQAVMWP